MKIVAIIPAYNEEHHLAASIKDVSFYVDEVVVVDDCSKDNTMQIALNSGAHTLRHIINRGQGAALQTGMDFADRVLQADIIVHFDGDGQMQGSDIPGMVELMKNEEYDIVLGSRFLGEVHGIPRERLIAVKGSIWMTALLSGIKLTDTHNGFRVLSKKAMRELRITMDRMAHASEILDLVKVKNLRYKEHPVTIRYTKERVASRDSSVSRAVNVLKDFFKGKFLG